MKFGNKIWGNHTVMTYLKTGVFDYWVPVGRPVHWEVSTIGSSPRSPHIYGTQGQCMYLSFSEYAKCAFKCLYSAFSSRLLLCLSRGFCTQAAVVNTLLEGQSIEGQQTQRSTHLQRNQFADGVKLQLSCCT